MDYAGQTVRQAGDAVVEVLSSHRIGAGLVAVDAAGRVHAPFNTIGMARGWIGADGALQVATHKKMQPHTRYFISPRMNLPAK